MEQLTDDILTDFYRITKYNVLSLIKGYVDFIDIHYSSIIDYFSGISKTNPVKALESLNSLLKEQKRVDDIIILNQNSISDYRFWILVEYIEDMRVTLETAKNISRWLRSSPTKDGYRRKPIVEFMLSQGQTLEDLERVKIGREQFRDTWVDTALQNQLREEDYDHSGGVLIKGSFANESSIFLNGVVDNIDTPEKTYGIDIDKTITWVDNDLKVLDYKDTIFQCAEILSLLKQGDDPSFPERGLSRDMGSNLLGITYPSIFRQLFGNFATDDSFKSIAVIDVKREQDAIMIEIQLETKAGAEFERQIQL